MLIPYVIERQGNTERSYDLYSRLMKDRIIMLGTAIDQTVANVVISQLLFLDSQDDKADIYMYINSPGGVITAGMAIYDTMQYIKSDVATVCLGQAASMGSFLLAAGTPGKRYSTPNSEIMIHQPLGGAQGQASDIQIQANHIISLKKKLNRMLSQMTGKDLETIEKDTDRDNFMTAEEAKEYGLVDEIITHKLDGSIN